MQADIRYEDDHFSFEDRWIGLNYNLATDTYTSPASTGIYDDRGAVLKSYVLKFGPLRVGFQDAIIFTGEYFDINYFADPTPMFFIHYISTEVGRPWSSLGNLKSNMGFFSDYTTDTWSAMAQVLVGDIDMNAILNPESYQNPDKIALSIGGTYDTPSLGKFGLYAAGATCYVFESTAGNFYSYTYYPGSAVDWSGTQVGIPLAEEELGYVNGENNLACMATWGKSFGGFDVKGRLELLVAGANSPANPWLGGQTWGPTLWLNDPVLEKKAVLSIDATYQYKAFKFSVEGELGYVFNELQLVAAPSTSDDSNLEPLWKPSSTKGLIGKLGIGCMYAFRSTEASRVNHLDSQ